MKKLLIKHDDGVSIREDIFQELDDDYEMFKTLFILANKACKRIVDGADYYEVVCTRGNLENDTNIFMHDLWGILDTLQNFGLISFCTLNNGCMLFVIHCIADEK